MLKKCFSLAAVAALGGSVVWGGCSGNETSAPGTTPTKDAGNDSAVDAGASEDSGSKPTEDAGITKDSGAFTGVDIQYGSCPTFTKCGGDIVGSWTVSGGCVSSDAFDDAKAKCDGLQESDVVIKANGTVVATSTTIERKTTVKLRAKVAIPKMCSPIPDCPLIEVGLLQGGVPGAPKFDSATCNESGAICNCDVEMTATEDTSDSYSAADDVITTTDPERTFEYCVQGSKATYRETTASTGFRLPITVELTK